MKRRRILPIVFACTFMFSSILSSFTASADSLESLGLSEQNPQLLIAELGLPNTVTTSNFIAYGASSEGFAEVFANPPSEYKPMTRFWWPNAPQDLDELREEVREIAKAGYGGIEIACVADVSGWVDPVEWGWGTENWNKAIIAALETAKEAGITVDLTVGPHWPLSIPGVTPDTDDSQKVLQSGTATVASGDTYNAMAPACDTALSFDWTRDDLMYVSAAKVGSGGTYNMDSMVAVPFNATTGEINWTAPDNGDSAEWTLFSWWMRGSGQRAQESMNASFELSDPIPYTVDHFSKAGTDAFINYWKSELLVPEVVELLKEVGGSMFEDSLELSGTIMWTPEFADYFQENRGYDITPYLPILEGSGANDVEAVERITEDYKQTLNDMYIEFHVLPMQDFMNSYGLQFRTQSYGGNVDSSQTGGLVDIIEGELLTFSGMGISIEGDNTSGEWTVNNKFRILRGGANLGRANILSDEIGSLMGGDYSLTMARLLGFMNSDFSGGVNNVVLHGYPYKYAPDTYWPTYATFSPMSFGGTGTGFGVALNHYTPEWEAWDEMLQYIHRTQFVLQQGNSSVDVAIYRHEMSTNGKTISDGTLIDKGYTYDYVSPSAFDNEKAYVEDGIFAPDSAGYRAMIVFDTEYITIEGAQKLLGYADEGLPIFIAMQVPSKVKGYGKTDQDGDIAAMMDQLLEKDNVQFVANESDLSDALYNAGIKPSAEFASDNLLLTPVRRTDGNVNYYYLFNRSQTEIVDLNVTLAGSGTPYLLNAYTGEISRIAQYTTDGENITLNANLLPRDTMMVAIGDASWYSDYNYNSAYAVSSDTDMRFTGKGLYAAATESGEYTIELNDGSIQSVSVEVPDPIALEDWHLSLESWTPANPSAGPDDPDRYDTSIDTYEIELGAVEPWSEMPDYKDVVGIGTYSTTITLEEPWDGGYNAYLDLDTVRDAYELYVNGEQVYANQITHVTDIGGYLQQGPNKIEVRVTSPMMNALIVNYSAYSGRSRTINGMEGTPRMIPYAVVTPSPYDYSYAQLQQLIELAELMSEDAYTPESWQAFAAALARAKAIPSDAGGDVISEAYMDLFNASMALVRAPEPGEDTYFLTITAGTGGAIVTGVGGDYAAGDVIWLEVQANAGYQFSGWSSSNGGVFGNADAASTIFIMPASNTTIMAMFTLTGSTGGSSGGGSRSSSNPSGGSSTRDTYGPVSATASAFETIAAVVSLSSNVNADGLVNQAAILTEAKEALTTATETAAVRTKNAASISSDTLSALAAESAEAGKPLVLYADTMAATGGAVQGRLYVEVEKATTELLLGVYTEGDDVEAVFAKFRRWFANNIAVVNIVQQGDLRFRMQVAAKIDLTNMDTESLQFYTYDKSANMYNVIDGPNYSIDANGYLHFYTSQGGAIIVSDNVLTLK